MRVAVLWSHLSGYLGACLRTLVDETGCQLYVSSFRSDSQAPFSPDSFQWLDGHRWQEWPGVKPDRDQLLREIVDFSPDAILASSWHHSAYRYVLRECPQPVRILCMDNPWLETLKQWVGRWGAPWYIAPLYDAAFVPGERQYQFARRLGFADADILHGLLTCDRASFSRVRKLVGERSFVYVGRLSQEKGIDVLLQGYQKYRDNTSMPWPLWVFGAGPMLDQVLSEEGVIYQGFIQPEELPQVLATHGCLVLPSLYEAWGVVIHESVSAGLPVICSTACGGAVHLVRDFHNGLTVPTGDSGALARAMQWMASQDADKQREMRENSHHLSYSYSPNLWVETLVAYISSVTGR